MNKYCLPDGYRENAIERIESGQEYSWTPRRIAKSKHYQKKVYQVAAAHCAKLKGARVLDIGCGTGIKLLNIVGPSAEVLKGMDREEAIELCRRLHGDKAEFVVTNLERPGDEFSGTYDVVIIADVIEHLQEPEMLLRALPAVTHKGTIILISTPDRDVLRGKGVLSSPKDDHVREWNQEELQCFLRSEGYRVESTELCSHMAPNLSLEYLQKLLNPWYPLNHTQLIVAKVK